MKILQVRLALKQDIAQEYYYTIKIIDLIINWFYKHT